jgi:hypothetical protein
MRVTIIASRHYNKITALGYLGHYFRGPLGLPLGFLILRRFGRYGQRKKDYRRNKQKAKELETGFHKSSSLQPEVWFFGLDQFLWY